MIRRPPRSTQSRSSAASDVYKRQDIHFLMFHPLDPRNTAARKRTQRHQEMGTTLIVVAIDTHTLPEGVMRVSMANCYGLCNAMIEVRDIDTIMECIWDAQANKWIVHYLYMKQLAEHDVSATTGNSLKDYTRVATLVIRARKSAGRLVP